jgi:hypothetical protein
MHITDRRRVTGLVGQFLKAGVLAEDQFLRTDNRTLKVVLSHRCFPESR